MAVTLLERSDYHKVLLINTHHIISDRWSVGILMQELAAEYISAVRGEPAPSKPASSYIDASRRLEESIPPSEVADQLAYWSSQFSGQVEDLILRPTSYQKPRPAIADETHLPAAPAACGEIERPGRDRGDHILRGPARSRSSAGFIWTPIRPIWCSLLRYRAATGRRVGE